MVISLHRLKKGAVFAQDSDLLKITYFLFLNFQSADRLYRFVTRNPGRYFI